MPSFVLIHSPLVGPYTWSLAAERLRGRGHGVVVPSLLGILEQRSHFAQGMALAVREQLDSAGDLEEPVLVAHSAAGAYLPAIGAALDRPLRGYIFVDARLPAAGTSLSKADGADAVAKRRSMAQNGLLPPWSTWFDPAALQAVIPDDDHRERFQAELRPIPLGLFEESIPVPSSWPDAPCSYLRLSEFYEPQARAARDDGWRVLEIEAHHMHMLVEPGDVAEMLLQLAG